MRSLPLIFIIGLVALASCTKKDNHIFRWTDLSPKSDSLVECIEWGYINLLPDDSLFRLIDELEKTTDILRTTPEFPDFFRAKIIRRAGFVDSAGVFIKRAEALCDSTKHPYEKHRINTLKVKDHNKYLVDFEYLENAYNYAILTNDTFLMATTANTLGILFNDLEDTLKGRDYVEKAMGYYKAIGLDRYARSVELNLVHNLFLKNDTVAIKNLLNRMRGDETLMIDSAFRVNWIIDVASYLREGWAIDSLYAIASRPNSVKPYHTVGFSAMKADLERDNGNILEGYKYSLKSVQLADNSGDLNLRAWVYPHHAWFCNELGMYDSAYNYMYLASQMRDSLEVKGAKIKILRANDRHEIEKALLIKENEGARRTLIICLIVAAAIIIILGITVWLAAHNRRLKIETERAKTDTERNRQLLGKALLRLHEKNESILNLSDHLHKGNGTNDNLPGIRKDRRILALNERGDKELETTSKLIDEVSSNLVVNLRRRIPNISQGMLQLAILIACDISNKEIADMLSIQPESVRKQRYRLRSLLDLPRSEKLEHHLRSLC